MITVLIILLYVAVIGWIVVWGVKLGTISSISIDRRYERKLERARDQRDANIRGLEREIYGEVISFSLRNTGDHDMTLAVIGDIDQKLKAIADKKKAAARRSEDALRKHNKRVSPVRYSKIYNSYNENTFNFEHDVGCNCCI